MNNYLGFYNGPLQASAGFSWASTGFYTGHFEPLRTSTDLNRPQLASFAINGRHMGICRPQRAFSDTPASNGTIVGQFWPQLASHGPLRAIHGPLRAAWALFGPHGYLRASTGNMGLSWASTGLYVGLNGLSWASTGLYWPKLASHGPLRASTWA